MVSVRNPLARRRTAAEPEPATVVPPKAGGKNRPTPKRSEAIAARPVTPYMKGTPKNRKEAAAAKRAARRSQAAEQRAAMRGEGDTARLPLRDRGPEKALARDVVDGRRNATALLFPSYLLFVFAQVSPVVFLLVLALFVGIALDAVVLVRKAQRAVDTAYPGSGVRVRFYAFQRSILPRRWRLPRPGVGATRR